LRDRPSLDGLRGERADRRRFGEAGHYFRCKAWKIDAQDYVWIEDHKARCRTRHKIKRSRLRTVDQRGPRGALSDTQAGIPEIDNSSAVTGHELAEIDLAALGRELLEKLDLLIL
jgi:hypothetical protein